MNKLHLLLCASLLTAPLACTPNQGRSGKSDAVEAPSRDGGPAETARVRQDVTLKLTGL